MADTPALTCTIALRTVSEANRSNREHWAQQAKRHRQQRQTTTQYLRTDWGRLMTNWQTPATITLTRIAPRALDTDNLSSALKHVRDGVADWCGTEDNDPLLTWEYSQEQGKPRDYAVRITLQEHPL